VPPESVRADRVSKSYPIRLGFQRRPALLDCSLEVRARESLAILGPNGSGKSTLLRTLAGLEFPDSGEAWILGERSGTPAAFRMLGFCPEESPFPPHMSAESCLWDLGMLGGLRGRALKDRVASELELWGLGRDRRTRVSRLSRGQQRRLAIAQALLHDPRVLLLDEPTSGLDALGIVTLSERIAAARAAGRIIVISSHVISDVENLCVRVAALRSGKKIADGTVEEVLGDPARWELVCGGLDRGGVASVEAAARAAGGTIVTSRPGRRALADLFRGLWQ
jgi:ABC-2 type transport system ATP-binding protein